MTNSYLYLKEFIKYGEKIKHIRRKMNEPYDASKEDYHNKIIKRLYYINRTLQPITVDIHTRGEISRVLKGLEALLRRILINL